MFSAKDDSGVQIRVPATANLMVDSADRNENAYPNPFDFQITKNNSILNGFFNRIGTTEVVLEWNEPNGTQLNELGGTFASYLSTGGATVSSIVASPFNANLFYNSAQGLTSFANQLNTTFGTDSFFISTLGGAGGDRNVLYCANGTFGLSTTALTKSLGVVGGPPGAPVVGNQSLIVAPDLRPFRYVDITSEQLTYNQELKDSSTAPSSRDVLCRWYFDWDNPPQLDSLGFPIEMGYEPFKTRRLFNPPKQIKWNSSQPLGNISFQVYGNGCNAPIQSVNDDSQFLMTLQASEN